MLKYNITIGLCNVIIILKLKMENIKKKAIISVGGHGTMPYGLFLLLPEKCHLFPQNNVTRLNHDMREVKVMETERLETVTTWRPWKTQNSMPHRPLDWVLGQRKVHPWVSVSVNFLVSITTLQVYKMWLLGEPGLGGKPTVWAGFADSPRNDIKMNS